MKFKTLTKFYRLLRQRLGDDMVYSLSLQEDKYYLTIGTHKSTTRKFNHGGLVQSTLLDDFDDELQVLVDKLVPMYEDILVPVDLEEPVI